MAKQLSPEMTDNQKSEQEMITAYLRTSDYTDQLRKRAAAIATASKRLPNEASIATLFDIQLFGFLNEVLGINCAPEKEWAVPEGRLRLNRGRADSRIGALLIEFKHPSKLASALQKQRATDQLKSYMAELPSAVSTECVGLLTDGTKCAVVRACGSSFNEGVFEQLSGNHLDAVVRAILAMNQRALTPENLVQDFCLPWEGGSGQELAIALHRSSNRALLSKQEVDGKTQMLFSEWEELFRLSHDDVSKQLAIEQRAAAVSIALGYAAPNPHIDEYLGMFAIQTAYTMIIKLLAHRVAAASAFSYSATPFSALASLDSEGLRQFMESLEDGATFRDMGIENLLEGDFYSWYVQPAVWTDEISSSLREVLRVLVKYEASIPLSDGVVVRDLFRDLYVGFMPEEVRHSLGEYYTPAALAEAVIQDALGLTEQKTGWRALDPCCGSGTFLTVLIRLVLSEAEALPRIERLQAILHRVKGIDLNPLAVLTARVNYFINVAPLIAPGDQIDIPVYLGDAACVPTHAVIEGVPCVSYRLRTLRSDLEVLLPESVVAERGHYFESMTGLENLIRVQDSSAVTEFLVSLVPDRERVPSVVHALAKMADEFVELEKKHWNGIWARIIGNFLTTASLGKFELVVGNPPWIDWKNLPENYRERTKSLCIDRQLFSGDSLTGGINLNICALIASVSYANWVDRESGVLGFLMPKPLLFQQTYEGFRNFVVEGSERAWLSKITDWTNAGSPFYPVQQEFATYLITSKEREYGKGVPVVAYDLIGKKSNGRLIWKASSFQETMSHLARRDLLAVQCGDTRTGFTFVPDLATAERMRAIAGTSYYAGREGIEFYPQELYLLDAATVRPLPGLHQEGLVTGRNFQGVKSKYKLAPQAVTLESQYLHPLIRGVDIRRFHVDGPDYVVPFPYDADHGRDPIPSRVLLRQAPKLWRYLMNNRAVLENQTKYYDRIQGKHASEPYSLARVGLYSFAPVHVVFRDNSKWQAAVVGTARTPWGSDVIPVFQNHAVSMCERLDNTWIGVNEAHYICAILNSPAVGYYITQSSDSRSYKVRPPVWIPSYDESNPIHIGLATLSKIAHAHWSDREMMERIDGQLERLMELLALQRS